MCKLWYWNINLFLGEHRRFHELWVDIFHHSYFVSAESILGGLFLWIFFSVFLSNREKFRSKFLCDANFQFNVRKCIRVDSMEWQFSIILRSVYSNWTFILFDMLIKILWNNFFHPAGTTFDFSISEPKKKLFNNLHSNL